MTLPAISMIPGIMEFYNRDAGAVLSAPPGVTPERLVPMCPKLNPNNTATQRQCTACSEIKPLDEFPRDKSGTLGRRFKCRVCHSAKNLQYYRRINQEEPNRVKEWRKASYQNNKESWRVRSREWARLHPEIGRNKVRRRRAMKYGAVVIDITVGQWEAQRAYFNRRCAYCHSELPRDIQDHIVPLAKSGNHTIDNVVPTCTSCNARKRDRSLLECLMKGLL